MSLRQPWKLAKVSGGQLAANGMMTLHLRIAEQIGSRIGQGKMLPGETLPNEIVLGQQFGVSRTAVREAIKVLSSKGLVQARRKTGTQVRARSEWKLLDTEVLSWVFSGGKAQTGLRDLLEVRRMIEPNAARLAAARATPEEQTAIKQAYLQMEQAAGKLALAVRADLNFHLLILAAAHNSFLLPFGALIETALESSFRVTSKNTVPYLRSLKLHQSVSDAICAGDADAAEAAMFKVLDQTSADIHAELDADQRAKPGAVRSQL